jgi:uncharacterized integral membrane protein
MKHKFKIGALIAAAVVILILIMQNTEPVETRLLFVTVTMPRALLLVITTALGFAGGVIVAAILRGRGDGAGR